ncbi:MAG TPA: tetratricopeptide repeat protein, partial [Anaerolineae bacterium]|nr:tetratricopeptide repeat protein [Anaerolineae bacterium]
HPQMIEGRTSGAFGSLGTLFESEGGTGRVRTLIWEGAVNLIRAHEPIAFPDGTSDPFNGIRTLVGYGPESMYVAYNRFYPPDLAHYEARNASPDRSHNETWDSMVITGAIGFLAEQFLFLSVFYFALKFIGWVPNRRASILLVVMMILGGIAGAIGLLVIKDVNFMGTGWPGGVAVGIVVYVISFALFHFKVSPRVFALLAAVIVLIADAAIFGATFTSANRWIEIAGVTALSAVAFGILYVAGRWAFDGTAGEPIAMGGHVFLIIALFGGMLAHYLESSLAGIAIVATRTYFWTYAAMLVVAGLNRVPADEVEAAPVPAARPVPAPPSKPPATAMPRGKKRKSAPQAPRPGQRPSPMRITPPWIGSTIAMALIGALVLSTLGFDFINTPPSSEPSQLPRDATEVLWNSLTRLPYKDNTQSPGVLLMFFVTWLFGAVVSLTELRRRNIITPANQWRAAGLYAGVSIAFSFAYWIFHASGLLNVIGTLFRLNAGPAASFDEYMGRFITTAEGFAGLLALFYVMVFAALIFLALSLYGEARARALPLAGEWGVIAGVPIAAAALAMVFAFNYNSIRADIIYKQGAPYVANNACDGAGQPISQCDIAIAHLKQALRHAPDEDFYMLALGASYLNKSAASTDEGSPLLIESSTYDSVFNLDAERTSQLNRRDALTAARVTLEHARRVNPLNTDHSANLARLHRRWSDLASSTDERRLRLDQSNKFYEQATNLSPNNAQLWNEWALVHFALYEVASQLGDAATAQAALDEAGNKLDQSLALDQEFADTYFYLASLYTVRNEPEKAQAALEQALRLNPDNAEVWARLTDQLLASGNYTEADRLTQDFLSRNPTFLPGWRTLAQHIYLPQDRLAEAANATQHALELSGQDPEHWLDQAAMAQILLRAGDPAAALPYAQTAVQLAPPERQADAQAILDAVQAALSGSSQSPLP